MCTKKFFCSKSEYKRSIPLLSNQSHKLFDDSMVKINLRFRLNYFSLLKYYLMTTTLKIFKSPSLFLLAAFLMILSSCSKDQSEITSIENLANESIEGVQHRAIGKNACLEFVFPISIQFQDESIATADSYEALHTTIVEWFEENDVEKARDNKPQLVFPIQVLTEEGEIVDVATKDELKELRRACPGSKGCKGKKGRGFKCFALVYPVTISINGVATTFEDKESLKAAVKEYKETAGDDAERPTLVFPITVEYDDGTLIDVNSEEELLELKEACKDEG